MARMAVGNSNKRWSRNLGSRAFAVVVSCLAALWSSMAFAQAYPTKPVKLIVPSAPGGTPDILGRLLAQKLTEALAQQVVVEHRPGAGGTIGMEAVAKSQADGYTLGLTTTSALSIAPALYPNIKYDPVSSFAPIGLLTTGNFAIYVHPSVPANSLMELIALAKSKPGQLNYGSVGNGSPHHIAGEIFKVEAGVNIVHVPYKSGAHIGLLANDVQIMFEGLGPFLQHVRAGKIKALAIAGPKRATQLPNVPTTAEAGLPGFEIAGHMGLVAPRGTPTEIIGRLNTEVVKALTTKEVREMFSNHGLEVTASSPEVFSALIRDNVVKWSRASTAAGAKLD